MVYYMGLLKEELDKILYYYGWISQKLLYIWIRCLLEECSNFVKVIFDLIPAGCHWISMIVLYILFVFHVIMVLSQKASIKNRFVTCKICHLKMLEQHKIFFHHLPVSFYWSMSISCNVKACLVGKMNDPLCIEYVR